MLDALQEGLKYLIDYITIRRFFSLLIAFALSGAIAVFMSQGAVLKYFGPRTDKRLAYLVASVSGIVLAVCSCSVLPMFASIRRKGAGLGPAIAFLFSGPAINVLAVTMTFDAFGIEVMLVRVIGAILLAVIIGLTMFALFHMSETSEGDQRMFEDQETSALKPWQKLLLFATLIGMLLSFPDVLILTGALFILLIIQLALFYAREDILEWGRATFDLAKRIVPLFLIGIFIAGIITFAVSDEFMAGLVGSNTYPANVIASLFGAVMYFATLTEIPIVESFRGLGMHLGPATALLLAGPSLSLPNMIVITRVIGIKRSLSYIALVVIFAGLIGLLAGAIIY